MQKFQKLHRISLNRYVFLFLFILTGLSFLWICTQPKLFWIAASLFLFQFFIFLPVREYLSKVNVDLRCKRIKESFRQKRPVFISTFSMAACMGLSLVGLFGYALLVNMCILSVFFLLMGLFWMYPPRIFSAEEEEEFWG